MSTLLSFFRFIENKQGDLLFSNNNGDTCYFQTYALILFRKGFVKEAIELLENKINKLEKLNYKKDKDAKLHYTVLVYNISQCYKKMEK